LLYISGGIVFNIACRGIFNKSGGSVAYQQRFQEIASQPHIIVSFDLLHSGTRSDTCAKALAHGKAYKRKAVVWQIFRRVLRMLYLFAGRSLYK
jgi:hypothetical protein